MGSDLFYEPFKEDGEEAEENSGSPAQIKVPGRPGGNPGQTVPPSHQDVSR